MTTASLIATFVLLLPVTNSLPVLPVVLGLTVDLPEGARRRTLARALATALVVGVAMGLFGGRALALWSLTLADLQVAGGLILLVFALHDLLFTRAERKRRAVEDDEGEANDVGVVPLGIPVLLGPAGMTALVVVGGQRPPIEVVVAFVLNLVLSGVLAWNADWVRRRVGSAVVRGVGKVMSLVLATLGIAMIRRGVVEMLAISG